MKSSLVNVECASSGLKAATTTTGGALSVSVSGWTVGECTTTEGGTCKANAVNGSTSGSLSWTSGANGSLSLTPGKLSMFVRCEDPTFFKVTVECTFSLAGSGSENMLWSVNGGGPAHVTGSGPIKKEKGSLCPKSGTYEADYTVSSPSPVYVAVG